MESYSTLNKALRSVYTSTSPLSSSSSFSSSPSIDYAPTTRPSSSFALSTDEGPSSSSGGPPLRGKRQERELFKVVKQLFSDYVVIANVKKAGGLLYLM